MAESIRYIEKEEIVQWIKRPGVRGYRYSPNTAVSWFLILSGIATLVLASLLTVRSGISLWIHKSGFAVLSAYTLWAFWAVGHWNFFAARNYLGVSDTELLVGRGPRAYLVPRSRISRETIDFQRMQAGRLSSALPLHIGNYRARIHLVGPFVNLQNVQQFIADILETVLQNDETNPDEGDAQGSGASSASPDPESQGSGSGDGMSSVGG